MRTRKRFSGPLLERWVKEGRGRGTFDSYQPWHQVSRSDPSSHGTSYIVNFRGRQVHLLSRQEHDAFIFCLQLPNLIDIREQFPLKLNSDVHERNDYLHKQSVINYPGTVEISRMLKYKHPKVDKLNQWIMTTDFLLYINDKKTETKRLVAVAVKSDAEISDRAWKLLHIERMYWHARGVEWLLITPRTYCKDVIKYGRKYFNYHDDNVNANDLIKIRKRYFELRDKSHYEILEKLIEENNFNNLNSVIWTAIWKGIVPLRLNKPFVLHSKPEFVLDGDFLLHNPISAGRSSWS